MTVTIAELVADPLLKLRFLAGEKGGARLVSWAHTSDLPNPTEWLGAGDFLMSNGINISSDAGDQVELLEDLVQAGLSGLGMGDDVHAPPLTGPLLTRADELAFPVLAIPHEVPFVAVSRTVANANSDQEHKRLVRTVQLYDTLRSAVSSGQLGPGLMRALEAQLGCELVLLDTEAGLPVLAGDRTPPPGLAERIHEEILSRKGFFPGVLRVEHDGAVACAIHVAADRTIALVTIENGTPALDLSLLQHAANIAALEVERISAERRHSWRLGSELMEHLLERRLDPASAAQQLREHGIDPGRVVIVAFRPRGGAPSEAQLHHQLAAREVVHLVHPNAQHVLAVVCDDAASLEGMRAAVGPDIPLGVSDPLRRADRIPDAAREALWAEAAARNLGGAVARYGDATPLFLPRTLGEAEMAAERIIGPLIEYDREHGSDLVRSLRVFLEHNRSWQRSAEVLHVHKQTLVYRMGRVETLTGRSLREMGDVVQLWLGLRALDFSLGEPVGHSEGGESAFGAPQ